MKAFKKQIKNKVKVCFRTFAVSILILIFSTVFSFAGQKVYFYHTDAAGTPLSMTDAGGNVVWQADYKPFGEESTFSGSVENKNRFVGKEKDEETGLYYFGARYMGAGIGRFVSVDPVGIRESDLLNPQRFNRYAYSLNNPYRYIDPDGNFPFLLLVVPAIIGIITSPSISETPVNSGDLHEDYADGALIMNTVAATTVVVTAATEGLATAGKEVVEEVTGVPISKSTKTANLSKIKKSKKIEMIGDGKITKTTEVRPGKGPGQSRSEYVRYKNAEGKTIRTYKDSYDRANKFQGRKPLRGGPEGRLQ